jgi:hypothetical protein
MATNICIADNSHIQARGLFSCWHYRQPIGQATSWIGTNVTD